MIAFVFLALAVAEQGTAADYDPLAVRFAPSPAQDFTVRDSARQREIPVRVYLPAERTPAPVLLFSHGLGGSREGSAWLHGAGPRTVLEKDDRWQLRFADAASAGRRAGGSP
ncbi:MAG: hypothetical protein FJ399_20795 [Verrucomicrobia bacterium]|nr:hypothetical protein [Verrucomicrobiota bacterium]